MRRRSRTRAVSDCSLRSLRCSSSPPSSSDLVKRSVAESSLPHGLRFTISSCRSAARTSRAVRRSSRDGRVSLITPALSARAPTLAPRLNEASLAALCLIARSARCDVRRSPPSSSDLVKRSVTESSLPQGLRFTISSCRSAARTSRADSFVALRETKAVSPLRSCPDGRHPFFDVDAASREHPREILIAFGGNQDVVFDSYPDAPQTLRNQLVSGLKYSPGSTVMIMPGCRIPSR